MRRVLGCRAVGQATVSVVVGDLTLEYVEAVVNAANARLQHGGGVAGAILRRGGPVIQEESDRWVARHGPLAPGRVAVTSGGALPARWVIHTVGPRWGEGEESVKLRRAVRAALEAAAERGIRSMAIPAISTGIYGYPKEEGTRIIVDEVCGFLARMGGGSLQDVRLVDISEETGRWFLQALEAWTGGKAS